MSVTLDSYYVAQPIKSCKHRNLALPIERGVLLEISKCQICVNIVEKCRNIGLQYLASGLSFREKRALYAFHALFTFQVLFMCIQDIPSWPSLCTP